MSWAHVQGTGVQASGAISVIQVSFVSSVTVGHVMVAGIATYKNTAATTLTPSDNVSNTWVSDTTDTTNNNDAMIGHSVATTGGSVNVAWTNSGGAGAYSSMSIDEFSFTGTLSVDSAVSCAASTTSTSSPAVGSLSVSGNDLVYGVLGIDGSTPTVTPSLTAAYSEAYITGTAEGVYAQYQINATTSTNPSWSLSGSATTFNCGVAYKTPGAAATGASSYSGLSAFHPKTRTWAVAEMARYD